MFVLRTQHLAAVASDAEAWAAAEHDNEGYTSYIKETHVEVAPQLSESRATCPYFADICLWRCDAAVLQLSLILPDGQMR